MKNHNIVTESIDNQRLHNILEKFKEKRVMVIGDIILDEYMKGVVQRISPEAPVPVVNIKSEYHKLGGAANVAKNIQTLSAQTILSGTIGAGYYGNIVKKMLQINQINDSYVIIDNRKPTTKKTRIISDHYNQQMIRLDWEDKSFLTHELENEIINAVKQEQDQLDAIIISDYGKGVITKTLMREIIAIANKKNIFISVDPKISNIEYYKNVSLITPNLYEAEKLAQMEITDKESLITAGHKIMDSLNCQMLLITRGKEGMTLFEHNNRQISNFPTVAKQVFDVTGAGDTVISVFTLAYISGATRPEAAWISNHAAGISVSRIGTYSVTITEILDSFKSENKQIK